MVCAGAGAGRLSIMVRVLVHRMLVHRFMRMAGVLRAVVLMLMLLQRLRRLHRPMAGIRGHRSADLGLLAASAGVVARHRGRDHTADRKQHGQQHQQPESNRFHSGSGRNGGQAAIV